MADLDDHERRITAVEHHVTNEAGLRPALDGDLADVKQAVRANTGLIKALGQTQADHGRMLNRIDREIGYVRKDVEDANDSIAVVQANVTGLREDVSGLRKDVSGLRKDVSGLRSDVEASRTDVAAMRAELHAEVGGLRRELHAEVGGLRQELHAEMTGVKSDMAELRTEMGVRFDQLVAIVDRLAEQRGSAA
jgi:chromosome segregation ATPase